MNRLSYFIKKQIVKRLEKTNSEILERLELQFSDRYQREYSLQGKTKVCTYQTGYARHFTRFYTSSGKSDFSFHLVAEPQDADVVVFVNTIDSSVVTPGQRVIFFFHEPRDYAHLYQTSIDWTRIRKSDLQVVSHLPIETFITNPDGVSHVKSIPYVHFHHMATYEELEQLDDVKREKQICAITSGLSGIPGYQKRRSFIEKLAQTNPNFDLFGKFNKQSAMLSPYRGPCITKWKTLRDYRYSLVIENSLDDYYISEKIFDALICGCMPIYHGSEKIFEILPKDWFYYLPTLDETELSKVNDFLKTEAYRAISENRKEIAATIYKKYSFYQALDNLLLGKPLSITPA